MELYQHTPASNQRAGWCRFGSVIPCCNIAFQTEPEGQSLELAMAALAERATERQQRIIALCHGEFDGNWVCFAKLDE